MTCSYKVASQQNELTVSRGLSSEEVVSDSTKLLQEFLEDLITYLDYLETRMTQETTENETDEFCEEKMK